MGKRQVESTPLLLPPSRAMIRISARKAAFSSGTVDCTSKFTTLQAALHEKGQRGCDLSGYQRSYIAAIWFSSQIEPMLCNAKHGLNVWKQYQKALFQESTFSQARGIQINVELVRLATSVTRETCLHKSRQRSCSLCGTFRDLEQSKAIPIAFLGYSSFPLMLWQGGKRDRQTAGPGEWNRHSGRKAAGNPCCSDDRTAEWAWESACLP